MPTKVIAKIFLYRMIFADAFGDRGYGGPAFAYANDSDFMGTSTSPKYWEKVIEKFFTKYQGIKDHSVGSIREAIERGRITIPTGRFYEFTPVQRKGRPDWPRTTILNYPVQGFSADYMRQVRLWLRPRLYALPDYGQKAFLVNTVHDDVQVDVDNNPELIYNISLLLEQAFVEAPKLFEKNYGFSMNVPMGGEVKFGPTVYDPDPPKVGDLVKFNSKTFEKDYETLWLKLKSSK